MLTVAGSLILVLLGLAVAGLTLGRRSQSCALVYGGCFGIATALVALGLAALAFGREPETLVLPLGVPWLGMHLRLDPLSAFFMLVVDLGAALACLYALGYARSETAPRRVLPFVPAFLAGMNLVLLADDAFTFLLAWEFMSLTSWALVLRDHEAAGPREAAYLYLVMASLGTAALLLCMGLLAGPGGAYDFASMLAGLGLTALAILVTMPVTADADVYAREDIAFALAVLLLGLLMMITRRNAVSQLIGFMSLENGLILAAAGAKGMPLVVELSVAFSVLIAFIVFGIFVFRIRERFDSVDVHALDRFRGE